MAAAVPYAIMAGAAVSAMGAMSAAKAQTQAANYNAQQNTLNARAALDQTNADVSRQQRRAEQIHGSLIAGVGASGVTMEGSPNDALRMSVENASLDEHNLRYMGQLKATGYYNEATLNRVSGQTATTQGYYGAASSLLTGAGQAAYSRETIRSGFRGNAGALG